MKTSLFLVLSFVSFSVFADVKLSADMRDINGPYNEIKITKENVRHGSTVTFKTETTNPFDADAGRNVEIIGRAMDCHVSRIAGKVVAAYCVEDRRPVDGPMKELTITSKRNGLEAVLKTTVISRMNGQQSSRSVTLATGLTEK